MTPDNLDIINQVIAKNGRIVYPAEQELFNFLKNKIFLKKIDFSGIVINDVNL
mgnify:CR=1 FL=1